MGDYKQNIRSRSNQNQVSTGNKRKYHFPSPTVALHYSALLFGLQGYSPISLAILLQATLSHTQIMVVDLLLSTATSAVFIVVASVTLVVRLIIIRVVIISVLLPGPLYPG